MQNEQIPTFQRKDQFLATNPQFSKGWLNDKVLEAESNGLKDCGAVLRIVSPGNKRGIVLIQPDRFFDWLRKVAA